MLRGLLSLVAYSQIFRDRVRLSVPASGVIEWRAESVLGQFKAELDLLGYSFDAKVINTANFGIPQNRRRTIGIGIDSTRYRTKISIPEQDPSQEKYATVAEAIGHLPPLAAGEIHPTVPNHRARALTTLNLQRISSAPPGENNSYLTKTPYGDLSLDCHRRVVEKWGSPSFTDTYTRMRGDAVGPTITTKCIRPNT